MILILSFLPFLTDRKPTGPESSPDIMSIEKVVVHEADKSTGDRRQKVDVYFNFIGCFVPPKPEVILTAVEEAKAQKALAARNREREQNKLRMRRVREAQRAAKEAEKVPLSPTV